MWQDKHEIANKMQEMGVSNVLAKYSPNKHSSKQKISGWRVRGCLDCRKSVSVEKSRSLYRSFLLLSLKGCYILAGREQEDLGG